jgi:hypothetical protein
MLLSAESAQPLATVDDNDPNRIRPLDVGFDVEPPPALAARERGQLVVGVGS